MALIVLFISQSGMTQICESLVLLNARVRGPAQTELVPNISQLMHVKVSSMIATLLYYATRLSCGTTLLLGARTSIAIICCTLPSVAFCGSTPILIQIQSPSVQTAWAEIDAIIRENEKLERPSGEPYLARAEIWAIAGSHEDALRDYLTATELLVRYQSNPSEQTVHFARLRTALGELVQRPRPHYPNKAQTEFHSGKDAFRANRISDAAWSFEEACRLNSDVPLYHVYRALTYKLLGRATDADREVAAAVSLIRYPGINTEDELREINSHLEFVQGPLRNWLNDQLAQRPVAKALLQQRGK